MLGRGTAGVVVDAGGAAASRSDRADASAPETVAQLGAARRRRLHPMAFPIAVTVSFLVLVGLGWNGSSSAVVRQQAEGSTPDPQHVFGEPNALRSDEWLVSTPLVVSQDSYDYPRVNGDLLGGTDLSVTAAVPYREWSIAFRPQYWGFLVLPFQQAFAFYWWLPALVLLIGCYAMVLAFCPGRPGMAALAAVAMGFAPFVQWWYLVITLGSLAWSAVIVAAFVRMEKATSPRSTAAWGALIAYATAALLLLMYPGFQIACGWVVVACVAGWAFRSGVTTSVRHRLRRLALAGVAGGVGIAVFGAFVATRWDVIRTVANTEYPGHRTVPTGQGRLTPLLSGFLDGNLRPGLLWPGEIGNNSSEVSNFVLVGLFLVVPACWLLLRSWRRERSVDGLLVALLALAALYTAVLFVPGLDVVAKLTLLSRVLPERLSIGLGLLSLALTAAVIRELDRQRVRTPWPLVAVVGGMTLGLHWRTGHLVERLAPALSGTAWRWLPLALVVTGIVVAAARGAGALALGGLAVLSVVSTYRVNPVYDGVYDTRGTALGAAIAATDRADPGAWIALGSASTRSVLGQQAVNRRDGVAMYPNFDEWTLLDPDGRNRFVYNRYALVSFTDDPGAAGLSSPTPDQVVVRLDACGPFAQRRIDHVVADHPVTDDCLQVRDTVHMPSSDYFIYDVIARSTPTRPGSTPR